MSEYCPDAYDQWAKLDRERYEREQSRPKCAECGEPVKGRAYRLGGELYCSECVENGMELLED